MNIKMIFYNLGKIFKVEGVLMLLPLFVNIIYQENYYFSFIIPIILLLAFGLLLTIKKPSNQKIFAKDGFVIVGLCWIFLGLFGSLPFLISGKLNFIDSFFETISGFTTTGASVISNIDTWYINSKSLLFWRSFTHWIGGMGVLVFVLAINPTSDGQNLFILKAESTGPQVGKIVSKLKTTATILYVIYFGLSIIELFFLLFDMPLFDAIVHVFATAGTGGFGIRAESLAYYSSYSQIVIAIFMVIFSINFNIFFLIIIGKFKSSLKNEELLTFIGIVIVSTIVISLNLYFSKNTLYTSYATSLKDSFFQVSSIISTTGFASIDFTSWPSLSISILFILMFIGGCAGSTAGGTKVCRVVLLSKAIKNDIKKVIHPNSVSSVNMDGNNVNPLITRGIYSYYAIIILAFVLILLIVSSSGFDFTSNISAVASCLNNVGPGLSSLIGPFGSYESFNVVSKLALIFAMLFGRLEIYPMLMIFNLKAWFNK